MAILKHIRSKNADYEAAIDYLMYQHDELSGKMLRDDEGRPVVRVGFLMDGINCEPFAWVSHDSGWFRQKAKGVEPACLQMANGFLEAGVAEGREWGWCEKLLRKLDRIPAQAIESACETALTANVAPSYKTVNTLIRNRAASPKHIAPAASAT